MPSNQTDLETDHTCRILVMHFVSILDKIVEIEKNSTELKTYMCKLSKWRNFGCHCISNRQLVDWLLNSLL